MIFKVYYSLIKGYWDLWEPEDVWPSSIAVLAGPALHPFFGRRTVGPTVLRRPSFVGALISIPARQGRARLESNLRGQMGGGVAERLWGIS